MASNRYNKWLTEQTTLWVADGLLSAQQAEQLRARYPATAGMSWGLFLLTAMGAIVFGLGIVLFFAYNWDELPKYAKLALIFSALLVAHSIGLVFSSTYRHNRNLMEGFHVLGTMMFGAGIWLIAQIYHIDEHYPTAFALWGLGALLLAWALPSVIQGLLATVLLLSWGFTEIFDFYHTHWLSLAVLVFGLVPLAWVEKSRVLLFCVLIAALVLALVNMQELYDESILFYTLFAAAILLICSARVSRYSTFPQSAEVLRTIGIALYGFLLLTTTFDSTIARLVKRLPADGEFVYSLVVLGIAAISWLLLTVHFYKVVVRPLKFVELLLVMLAIASAGLLLFGAYNENIALGVLLFNGVIAAHCVLLVIIGTEELNWRHVAVGCCTLLTLIVWRFNDLFQSLLMRSLVFLIVGAMLFFIGHIYARRSNEKLKALEVSNGSMLADDAPGEQSNA